MMALIAASTPLPPDARGAFAREPASLPELGDGSLHRTIVHTSASSSPRPTWVATPCPRVSKWER
jgi:hypothetical protein